MTIVRHRSTSVKFPTTKSFPVFKRLFFISVKEKRQGKGTNCCSVFMFVVKFNFGFDSCRLIIKSDHAFGEAGSDKFKIPPNATVEYTVTLSDFEKEPQSWKLSPEESLTQAKLVKEKATAFLKQEKYQLAIKLYEKSNSYLSNCSK